MTSPIKVLSGLFEIIRNTFVWGVVFWKYFSHSVQIKENKSLKTLINFLVENKQLH